jgi:hypothetical protein
LETHAFYREDGVFISSYLWEEEPEQLVEEPVHSTPEPVDPPQYQENPDRWIDEWMSLYNQARGREIQTSEVPEKLLAAFLGKYVNPRDVEWDCAGGVYHVEFELGEVDFDSWYTEDTLELMEMQEIRFSAIDPEIRSALTRDYPDYVVDDCAYFRRGTATGYLFELENRRTGQEIRIRIPA